MAPTPGLTRNCPLPLHTPASPALVSQLNVLLESLLGTLENVCRSLRQTYPDLCPLKQWEASELCVCASRVDEAPHAAPSPSPGLGPSQERDPPPWSRGVFGCHEGAGGAVCAHPFVHMSVHGDVCACGCSEIM